MDMRQLQYAVTVAEELNFTRAAARCHIAQSGLSHQIAQLEREIGAALFQRTSRRVQLTRAGHVFLPYARRVLRDCGQAVAEVAALRGVLAGRLRIGTIPFASAHVGLLELLRDYQESYPAIEVVVSDEGSLSTVTAILAGSIDAAFVGLYRDQLPAGLTHQLLALEPLVAVVGPDHPLRGAPSVDMGALADCSRFLESHPDSGLRAQVDAACTRARTRRQVACELRNPADLAALARQAWPSCPSASRRRWPMATRPACCAWLTGKRCSRWPSSTPTRRPPARQLRRSSGSSTPAGRPHRNPEGPRRTVPPSGCFVLAATV
jgi:DNA-binding transcriptional LysR family regulator